MSTRLLFLLVAIVTAWVLAMNTGRQLIFNMAYLLTGVLVVSYGWAWTSVRFVEIRRFTRARRSQVGQAAEEIFEIYNRSRLPKLWLELDDHSTLPFHDSSRVVSNLRSGNRRRWQVKTYCQVRGRFRLGPMTLRSSDPLGLFTVVQELTATSAITVYPATVDLVAFRPPMADLAGGEAISRRTHYVTTNVASVREYAPGDSFNRIHWLSTARTGRLMTKEFELDPTADIWIFLDLAAAPQIVLPWQPYRVERNIFRLRDAEADGLQLPPSTVEYAVTTAASIARYFLTRNRAVGLATQGQTREILPTDRGERQLSKILETLAVVEAVGEASFAQFILTEGVRLSRNNTILAISPDPNPEWAYALREMRSRGVYSIAAVVDGSTFAPGNSYGPLLDELEATGIPRYRLGFGQKLEDALSVQAADPGGSRRPMYSPAQSAR